MESIVSSTTRPTSLLLELSRARTHPVWTGPTPFPRTLVVFKTSNRLLMTPSSRRPSWSVGENLP